MSSMRIENVCPVLGVADIARSLAFYVDCLGFENAAWGDEQFTYVTRDGGGIYLSTLGHGQPGMWVWVGVEDARAIHDHLVSCGISIRRGLENKPWALEFHVEDPDGHVLWIGSDPDEGAA